MDYIIEKMDRFTLAGYERNFDFDSAYKYIPEFWDEFMEMKRKDTDININGVFGVCIDDIGKDNKFRYMIADMYDGGKLPGGFTTFDVGAYYWAKFTSTGPLPDSLQKLNSYVKNTWLRDNGKYEMAAAINIEMYTMGDMSSSDYISEIWIPVKEKQEYQMK
ncbi:MAG: effector binding domain-containing protein [Oscillospiraceae bacterium]|nr:effector binding domain-containing protein [Oscillospiraceae bacterium]